MQSRTQLVKLPKMDRAMLWRSLAVAILVGPVLTMANQHEAVFGLAPLNARKAAITFIIPFLVSAISGAMAARRASRAAQARHEQLLHAVTPAIASVDLISANAESVNFTAKARFTQTTRLLDVARQTVAEIEGSAALIEEALAATEKVRAHFEAAVSAEDLVQRSVCDSTSIARRVADTVAETRIRFSEIATLSMDIGRLSHQTSLLSLNAAVVAATAGPEGRRLAAIADSVRELARQTDAHSKKISKTMVDLEHSASDLKSGCGSFFKRNCFVNQQLSS